jgi:hypothetical protein
MTGNDSPPDRKFCHIGSGSNGIPTVRSSITTTNAFAGSRAVAAESPPLPREKTEAIKE